MGSVLFGSVRSAIAAKAGLTKVERDGYESLMLDGSMKLLEKKS